MKTEDAGLSWTTSFNETTPQKSPGSGVGGMGDVACFSTQLCYAVSTCGETVCAGESKDRGYGSYVLRTDNGGDTWTTGAFVYEAAFTALKVLGEDDLLIGGGETGAFSLNAFLWRSTDGGASLKQEKLSGAGIVLGLDVKWGANDSAYAVASTCQVASSKCALWRAAPLS